MSTSYCKDHKEDIQYLCVDQNCHKGDKEICYTCTIQGPHQGHRKKIFKDYLEEKQKHQDQLRKVINGYQNKVKQQSEDSSQKFFNLEGISAQLHILGSSLIEKYNETYIRKQNSILDNLDNPKENINREWLDQQSKKQFEVQLSVLRQLSQMSKDIDSLILQIQQMVSKANEINTKLTEELFNTNLLSTGKPIDYCAIPQCQAITIEPKEVKKTKIKVGEIFKVVLIDRETFATLDSDRRVLVWDLHNLKNPIHQLVGHERGFGSGNCLLKINPDFLASGADDCLIIIWKWREDHCYACLPSPIKVQALEKVSSNLIASGGEYGDIIIWNWYHKHAVCKVKGTMFRSIYCMLSYKNNLFVGGYGMEDQDKDILAIDLVKILQESYSINKSSSNQNEMADSIFVRDQRPSKILKTQEIEEEFNDDDMKYGLEGSLEFHQLQNDNRKKIVRNNSIISAHSEVMFDDDTIQNPPPNPMMRSQKVGSRQTFNNLQLDLEDDMQASRLNFNSQSPQERVIIKKAKSILDFNKSKLYQPSGNQQSPMNQSHLSQLDQIHNQSKLRQSQSKSRWSIPDQDENKDLDKMIRMKFHEARVNNMVIVSEIFLISVDSDGWIVMWELESFTIISQIRDRQYSPELINTGYVSINCVKVINNDFFATFSTDKMVQIWQIDGLIEYHTRLIIPHQNPSTYDLMILPNNQMLTASSSDIKIWNLILKPKPQQDPQKK